MKSEKQEPHALESEKKRAWCREKQKDSGKAKNCLVDVTQCSLVNSAASKLFGSISAIFTNPGTGPTQGANTPRARLQGDSGSDLPGDLRTVGDHDDDKNKSKIKMVMSCRTCKTVPSENIHCTKGQFGFSVRTATSSRA